MSSNNSKKRLEIKSITFKTTYNLTKSGMSKINPDNKRLLTGIIIDLNKNNNNANNNRKNSHSNNKNISKQNKRNKKSLDKSPNIRLTSPQFLSNNNFMKNKGSSTPSVSPLMFSLSQTSKNKNNNLKVGIKNLISDIENKFNKTFKNNDKNIIIHSSNLDNNYILSQAKKKICKSVGKDSQNMVSKRNFNGLLLDPGNKTENNYLNNKIKNKKITKIENNLNIIQINSNINSNTNINMNSNNSNQSNSNIIKKRNQNNGNNGLISSTSTNSINNFNKNVNNIKTVNLINNSNENSNKNNSKINKSNFFNKNNNNNNKRGLKTKSAEQTSHNPKFYKNELVYNTNYIINFIESKNEKISKNKERISNNQKNKHKQNKISKNQNTVLNVQNNLKKINSENMGSNKEKSNISSTTNNLSTTSGNNIININSIKKDNYSDGCNIDELNLEELHFFLVEITQNYKKCESEF